MATSTAAVEPKFKPGDFVLEINDGKKDSLTVYVVRDIRPAQSYIVEEWDEYSGTRYDEIYYRECPQSEAETWQVYLQVKAGLFLNGKASFSEGTFWSWNVQEHFIHAQEHLDAVMQELEKQREFVAKCSETIYNLQNGKPVE